jgi:hypothetical protein
LYAGPIKQPFGVPLGLHHRIIQRLVIVVELFFFASFFFFKFSTNVDKSTAVEAIFFGDQVKTYAGIQSSTACFKLRHQIEIRAGRLINKVLMVLKTC